jgi:Domain of unknown function (DUF4160)
MVVVHRALGFRFVIYTFDHEPAHIHVTGSGQAKINLLGPQGEPELVYSIGIKRHDAKKLLAEVREQQARLLKEWELIHGNTNS